MHFNSDYQQLARIDPKNILLWFDDDNTAAERMLSLFGCRVEPERMEEVIFRAHALTRYEFAIEHRIGVAFRWVSTGIPFIAVPQKVTETNLVPVMHLAAEGDGRIIHYNIPWVTLRAALPAVGESSTEKDLEEVRGLIDSMDASIEWVWITKASTNNLVQPPLMSPAKTKWLPTRYLEEIFPLWEEFWKIRTSLGGW